MNLSHISLNRLRPMSTMFSYYQHDNDDEDELEYSGIECDYMSPVTQESHLSMSPMEDRVVSPCSDLDLDTGTIVTTKDVYKKDYM